MRGLRRIPVWLFSSGPLDDSADSGGPTEEVAVWMERLGAVGHATFGGRLEPDAKGFPASAMARSSSGDWRNPAVVRAWAEEIARVLPEARPRPPIDPPARSIPRLVAHGGLAWAACSAIMGTLLATVSTGLAVTLHAILAPLVFVGVSVLYFRRRGAREPWSTAAAFVAITLVLDAVVVSGIAMQSLEMFRSFVGTWLPLGLGFVAAGGTGAVMATMPSPTSDRPLTKAA